MIFQDPMMTLNPVLRVDTQMIEAIRAHRRVGRGEALALARDALAQVGIPSPERRLKSYPHELSGGMRQRVAIAIAFINKPDLVIADEPTTALDVTIQAQILHEAQELCRKTGTAMIWISHDLAVVSSLADRVAVMYAGVIVEQGRASDVIRAPLHPYTKGLLGSVPSANARGTRLAQIPGMTPSLLNLPAGCRFRARCPRARRRVRSRAGDDRAPARPRGALLAAARGGAGAVTAPSAVPMIEARGLTKRFVKAPDLAQRASGWLGTGAAAEVVQAVDNVSLAIGKGEVVGLVGESGCGKSTLGRMIAGLLEPTEGQVLFKGKDRAKLAGAEAKAARLAVQMIFQDPYSSLNPRMRVEAIVGEAPLVHGLVPRAGLAQFVADMLTRVGLDPEFRRRFPHQFSGGQRSRIGIARALAVNPEFLVCDEAIAALDVSIQAQIINLFLDLREAYDLTYLFISHDLGVVQHISDRILIMYLGRIVEAAPTPALFEAPNHPYTRALLAEVPRISLEKRSFQPIKGEIPSPLDPPRGCHFHPRCPLAMPRCRSEVPALKAIAPGRTSACHLNDA